MHKSFLSVTLVEWKIGDYGGQIFSLTTGFALTVLKVGMTRVAQREKRARNIAKTKGQKYANEGRRAHSRDT